ncbi:MAG: lipopolysaccharide biosynthesis protein [Ferruginibacter sp.]
MSFISLINKYAKTEQAKSIAIYTFSNFFNKGVSFLLLFYFTHALLESDFGLLSLFSNSILLLMPFVSMGILQSVNTDYFKMEKAPFKDFFTTTLIMPIVVTLLIVITAFFLRHQLHSRYSFPNIFIVLIPVITFFNFLNEHLINMVRNNNEPIKYLIINVGRLMAEIALAVFFISALQYGWLGRVMGILISYFVVAVYAFIYFKQQGFLFGKLRKKVVIDELIYSVPIIIMQMSIFAMNSSSGYYIEYFTHSYSTVGIYSVAATFASIIIVLCGALLQYVYPKIYSLLSENEINYPSIKKHFLFYAGAMLGGTLLVIIFTPLAYAVVLKPSYHEGLSYYYFICLGYFFWTITYFFYSFMLYYKLKRKILLISLISIVVSVLCNYFFIKHWGSYGAALAIFTGYLSILIITLLFVKREIVAILHTQPVE